MAYTDIHAAATDENHVLRKQTAVAIHKAAVDVVNEDAGTTNHSNRLTWARKVLGTGSGPTNEAAAWIWKVLENATIQAAPDTSSDNDVQFQVNSMVNDMANL